MPARIREMFCSAIIRSRERAPFRPRQFRRYHAASPHILISVLIYIYGYYRDSMNILRDK